LIVRKWDAYRVFLIKTGIASGLMWMVFTINMVYYVRSVGMNPLQLVLVGTVLEVTAFIFEVPTGVVADVVSRRLSTLIGFALIGVGFLIEGAVPRFGVILLAQVVAGLGYTFTSGAVDAWIVDEIGVERAGEAFTRGAQVGRAGAIAGMIAGAGLAAIRLNLPILIAGGLLIALAVFLALVMPETGFTPRSAGERPTPRMMIATLRDGVQLVRARPVLLMLVAVMGIYGMYSEGVDRLWNAHFLTNFSMPAIGPLDSVVWFGVIGIIAMLLAMAGTEIARRRLDMNNQAAVARALVGLYGLLVLVVVAFAAAPTFALALAAYWLMDTLRGVADPLYDTWVNQHITGDVRATVLSMISQSNAIGQIAGGPVVGWIGTVRSLRAALVTSALILAPSVPLIARTARRHLAPEIVPVEQLADGR
jgi:DHA3 family tetracycline resistance protein-like MFS transporter